jgi:hypothetical protein
VDNDCRHVPRSYCARLYVEPVTSSRVAKAAAAILVFLHPVIAQQPFYTDDAHVTERRHLLPLFD